MRSIVLVFVAILGITSSIRANPDQIVSTYGDLDGFGFSVEGLVDATGAAADRDGDGILDEGDSLPDINGDGAINPNDGDTFNNRLPDDPLVTDVGMLQSVNMVIPFTFQIPPGHLITSATFRITVGDASLINAAHHHVIVDGVDTGQVLEPRDPGPGGDGLITITEVFFDSACLAVLEDGDVDVVITYDTHQDDIAVDYAELTMETTAPCECPDSDGDGVPDAWDECPNTPQGSAVYSNGCPGSGCQGDFDGDGDVDSTDLSVFAENYGWTDCCGDNL